MDPRLHITRHLHAHPPKERDGVLLLIQQEGVRQCLAFYSIRSMNQFSQGVGSLCDKTRQGRKGSSS